MKTKEIKKEYENNGMLITSLNNALYWAEKRASSTLADNIRRTLAELHNEQSKRLVLLQAIMDANC